LRLKGDPREAKRCHERLLAAGIIGDWREPDILRWAPTPLYNSFSDAFAAVDMLTRALRP
jgi:kynureninase